MNPPGLAIMTALSAVQAANFTFPNFKKESPQRTTDGDFDIEHHDQA